MSTISQGQNQNAQNFTQWISSIGISDQFSAGDLQSGSTINSILKIVVPGYNNQMSNSNTALTRVNNWNILTEQLKKLSIKISQEEKTKIINGNHDLVFNIISKLKENHLKSQKQTQVDLDQIDPKKQPNQTQSLLQLLLTLIMKNFNLTSKESVALLSNQSKYLAHILTKGLKGQYKPIQGLINDLQKAISKILQFCKNKQNQVFFLRSIKPALISKSESVAFNTLKFILQFINNFDSNEQYNLIKIHLIGTFLLTIKRHPHLGKVIANSIFQISKYEPGLLRIIINNFNKNDLQSIFLVFWKTAFQNDKIQAFVRMDGFKQLVSQFISNTRSQSSIIGSTDLIIQMYTDYNQYFQDDKQIQQFFQNITSVSIQNKADEIAFIHQCFTLLQIFGNQKHFIAPSLYKFLIEKYKTCQQTMIRQILIINLKQIVQMFPSIPWNFIIEIINQHRESQNFYLGQLQLQFFQTCLENENIQLKTALQIYDMVSKLFIQSPYIAYSIVKILVRIIQLFRTEEIICDLTNKLIKVSLAIHFANFKKFSQKRKSVTGQVKLSEEEGSAKIKNLSIQFMIRKIAQIKQPAINNVIQPLVAFTYIPIKDQSKQNIKGLQKILSVFGKIDEIVKKYEEQIKKAQQQEKRKNSKVKQTKGARYDSEGKQKQQPGNNKSFVAQNKIQNTNSFHKPMSLSYVGITSSAIKGLQKYQKVYLQKIQKQDFQKIKKIEEQQRYNFLKKLYKKKMMSEGIDVKMEDNQIRYLFEFDSKDNLIVQKHFLKVPYYTLDSEEDRDLKAMEKIMKSFQKPLKVIYNIYSGHKKGIVSQNFDQFSEKSVLIHSSAIYKFLKDFQFQQYINLKEIQYLTQKINYQLNQNSRDSQNLDFQSFVQFIKQLSFLMYTRSPKDLRGHPLSEMLEQTFSQLKLFAVQNKMDEHLFQDPDNVFYNQTEAVIQLNKKLTANPDYILPQGYKKIVDKRISFQHGVFLQALSITYKQVYQVLDQILYDKFKFHIIQPFTRVQTIVRARPALYFAERIKMQNTASRHISVLMKKQIAKFPIIDRQIAKESAVVLEQIMQAIQLGHDKIGQKHLNKVEQSKKLTQQERKKILLEEKKRRQSRNRETKTAIQKYKQKQTQKQKTQKQKKEDLERKQREEKQKKQKQQKQRKKKVEQYSQLKKIDEQKKKQQKKEQQQKQKLQIQRKKQQNQEIKKKIQEEKKKRQEQEKNMKKQKQLQEKKRKEEEKKKMQQSQKMKKQMIEQFKMKKSNVGSNSQTKNIQSVQDQNNNDKKKEE